MPRGRPKLTQDPDSPWICGMNAAAKYAGVHRTTLWKWCYHKFSLAGQEREEYTGGFEEDEFLDASQDTKEICGQSTTAYLKTALKRLGESAAVTREMNAVGAISMDDRELFAVWGKELFELEEKENRAKGHSRKRVRGYDPYEEAALYGETTPFPTQKAPEHVIDEVLGLDLEETYNAVVEPGGDPEAEYSWAGTLVPHLFIDEMEIMCEDSGLAYELIAFALDKCKYIFDPETIKVIVEVKYKEYLTNLKKTIDFSANPKPV